MLVKILRQILIFTFTRFAKFTAGGYGNKLTVNFYTRFTKNTFLGNNTNFNGLTVRGSGKVIIGDNFHSGKDILLINSYHKYDFANAIPYDTKETTDKEIVIEDNVWIGDKVIILGGVHIGEGAIIQAGAVVVSNIAKYGIAGGNPAKVFKYRNIESYEKLKQANKVN